MNGIVSDIISFSLNDGPGIRTTVFLKGCPLRCRWCHNPETQRREKQMLYSAHLCAHCGRCQAVCPVKGRNADGSWVTDGSVCTGCEACAGVCPAKANIISGKEMTAEEVTKRVLRDQPFFRKRGGVTFSGGEPLMQAAFVGACAEIFKTAGVHIAIETSLYADWEAAKALIPVTDLFLCDWKITDPEAHRAYTGASNACIRENLIKLDAAGAHIVLRCPVIPGINDNEGHFEGIGALADALTNVEKVEILPYHDVGNSKRLRLGAERDGFSVPTNEQKQEWLAAIQKYCVKPVLISGG